ncbi:MAG TPA: leucyl aminopeptidase [Candidatus Desulfovibrio intestinigallinarum]|nr:leucyl aminopeptidase [Candidatus Desulfovibrio intestinigallinarum]
MDIRFQCNGPAQWKADVMVVLFCKGERLPDVAPCVDAAAPWLAIAPALRDARGDKDELTMLHGHPELNIPRVLAVGLGAREDVDVSAVRKALGSALRRCRAAGIGSVLIPEPMLAALPGGRERLVEEAVYASLLGLYRFSGLKKADKDERKDPEWLAIGFEGEFVPDGGQAAARRGERAAEAVALARTLANTPANLLGPADLAEKARALAAERGLSCTVMEEDDLREQGMNCLLAVGQGSARPPRLVVLEHAPEGHEQEKPLILVGKGITFDSGGISLKPGANMHAMKCDMTGAAIVLSVLAAVAEEQLPRRIVGIMACADNMPDGRATRPGDVVVAANGDSVEIQNTDAEGRLALCDALAYAQKEWTPAAIVDIATLTGACAVALGSEVAGLFCDDDALRERLQASATLGGEALWPLPLWKGYKENLKSEVADICHIGPREGGAIHAALFLQHFIQDGVRWAHLDIAGVDWASKPGPLTVIGGTAFGARTLLELARGGV